MKNTKQVSAISGTAKLLRLQLTLLQQQVRAIKKELHKKRQARQLKGRAAEAAAYYKLLQTLEQEQQATPSRTGHKRRKK